jgi:hypothetical protein
VGWLGFHRLQFQGLSIEGRNASLVLSEQDHALLRLKFASAHNVYL